MFVHCINNTKSNNKSFYLSTLKRQYRFLVALTALLLSLAGVFFTWYYFQRPFAPVGILDCCFFYGCISISVISSLYLLVVVLQIESAQQKNVLFSICIFFVSLFIAETALRVFHINRAYIESRGGKYLSPYPKHNTDTLFIIRAQYPKMNTTEEFSYPRIPNNVGFRDLDFSPKRDSLQFLIQTFGDSFTEGDGAPADSAYPATLKRLMRSDNIVIQNFGIMGSDPAFYWMQMKEIGAKLHPDIAVVMYCSLDLTTDFFTRGGLERFKNGYYSGFDPPIWEWLYGYSYLFRLFANSVFDVSYNNFFLTQTERQKRFSELELKWNETFHAIENIARKHNLKVLLIKKPERSEIDLNGYNYDFTFFEKMADTISVFKRYDLLPFYRDSMGINNTSSANYYWPKDGHHNSTGYAVMAQGVYAGLKHAYPEIFSKLDSAKAKE